MFRISYAVIQNWVEILFHYIQCNVFWDECQNCITYHWISNLLQCLHYFPNQTCLWVNGFLSEISIRFVSKLFVETRNVCQLFEGIQRSVNKYLLCPKCIIESKIHWIDWFTDLRQCSAIGINHVIGDNATHLVWHNVETQ